MVILGIWRSWNEKRCKSCAYFPESDQIKKKFSFENLLKMLTSVASFYFILLSTNHLNQLIRKKEPYFYRHDRFTLFYVADTCRKNYTGLLSYFITECREIGYRI